MTGAPSSRESAWAVKSALLALVENFSLRRLDMLVLYQNVMNDQIYDKAVALLNVRMHTTGELFQKLTTRGFKPAEIGEVLRKLEELGFLDDQKFAEIFVDNLKRYKDFGYYGIKANLLARKIPSDMAEGALSEFFTLEDEEIVARRLIGKLKRQGRDTFEKLAASLQGKGFRGEVIRKVLNK